MDCFKPLSPLHNYDDPLDVDDSYKLFPLLDDDSGTNSWFNDFSPSQDLDFESQHSQIFCSLCDCLMNSEDMPVTRKKRRRNEEEQTAPICEDCANATISVTSSESKNRASKAQRITKRKRSKVDSKTSGNGESVQLRKLRQQQAELLEKSKNLPAEELKRLKQVVRNRISAQQSRDKKKLFMADMQVANEKLEDENQELRDQIEAFERENVLLKEQIGKIATSEAPYFSSTARAATIALASILSVMMLVGSVNQDSSESSTEGTTPMSSPPRNLIDLSEFKNSEGECVEEKVQEILSDHGIQIENFLPAEIKPGFSPADYQNTFQSPYDYDTMLEDPCAQEYYSEMQQDAPVGAISTAYCPSVQMHWKESSQGQVLQLLMPNQEDIPFWISSEIPIPKGDEMVEVLCKVIDVQTLPKNAISF